MLGKALGFTIGGLAVPAAIAVVHVSRGAVRAESDAGRALVAAGESVASPTPTRTRAPARWAKPWAAPEAAVMALHSASPPETSRTRDQRSAMAPSASPATE